MQTFFPEFYIVETMPQPDSLDPFDRRHLLSWWGWYKGHQYGRTYRLRTKKAVLRDRKINRALIAEAKRVFKLILAGKL